MRQNRTGLLHIALLLTGVIAQAQTVQVWKLPNASLGGSTIFASPTAKQMAGSVYSGGVAMIFIIQGSALHLVPAPLAQTPGNAPLSPRDVTEAGDVLLANSADCAIRGAAGLVTWLPSAGAYYNTYSCYFGSSGSAVHIGRDDGNFPGQSSAGLLDQNGFTPFQPVSNIRGYEVPAGVSEFGYTVGRIYYPPYGSTTNWFGKESGERRELPSVAGGIGFRTEVYAISDNHRWGAGDFTQFPGLVSRGPVLWDTLQNKIVYSITANQVGEAGVTDWNVMGVDNKGRVALTTSSLGGLFDGRTPLRKPNVQGMYSVGGVSDTGRLFGLTSINDQLYAWRE
jgi:hypothetical protein